MEKQAIKDAIVVLFNGISETQQVDLMVELYYSLSDYMKDRFLERTENS